MVLGLIHMMGGLTKSVTAILRQLIDAGTLSNFLQDLSLEDSTFNVMMIRIQPGEWRDVDAPRRKITDAFMPLPYKEPSGNINVFIRLL